MTPDAGDKAIVSATLSRYLAEIALRVDELKADTDKAATREQARKTSRVGRIAAAVHGARTSPRGALRAPARLARAMRAIRPDVRRPDPAPTLRERSIRLIPRAGAGVAQAPGDGEALRRRAERLAAALRSGRRLTIAGSFDERTALGLGRECDVIALSPNDWRAEVTDTIDLLLIEPARRKPGVDAGARLSGQLAQLAPLVRWCHERDIPTAMWNTCDPFDRTFTEPIARIVDHVFTGDLDSVGWYATRLAHDRIHVCPVATQPSLYNPVSPDARQKKPAAAFAGAYDASCAPRIADLDKVIEGASRVLPVEILRGSTGLNGDIGWPERYDDLMVSGPPPTPRERACQGYEIALNASTARSSSTVLPRRVFDQLASGVPTVSAYTRGIRVLLGDLVPMSDHADGIEALVGELRADRDRFDKRRVMGVRRVLAQHTYRRRLEQIASTVAGTDHGGRRRQVCAVAAVGTASEAVGLAEQLEAQLGVSVTLVLVSDVPGITVPGARVITSAQAGSLTFGELDPEADAFAVVRPENWHGPHYLSGLFDGLDYSDAEATTKHARYRHSDELVAPDAEYTWVSSEAAWWSRSLVRRVAAATVPVDSALRPSAAVSPELRTLAVDRFDFCETTTAGLITSRLASELDIDGGRSLDDVTREADRVIAAALSRTPETEVDPECFPVGQVRQPGRGRAVVVDRTDGHLIAYASDSDRPWYLPIGGDLSIGELGDATGGSLSLALDADTKGGTFGVNVAFNDTAGRRLPGLTYYRGAVHRIAIPDLAASVRLAFTMKGEGVAHVRSIRLSTERRAPDAIAHLADPQTRTLLLTDFYSSYESPYQRSFIHSRVRSYQRFGAPVDVWVNRPRQTYIAHREFDGVEVSMGSPRALRAVLASGAYDTVLVHTMYEPLWALLKDYVDRVRVVAWMHGGELHRWWLDKENPTFLAPREVQIEQIRSDPRFRHWVSVLTDPHPNLLFVFVSQTYLDQANEDLALFGVGFPPDQTVVIPNPVDPERFDYATKPSELRTRLMSLRPFHSANYANDLTVAAVVELMSEPWFGELDILIAGNGPAFDEITAPLRDVPNVTLAKKFYATQGDIANLYRERGVLLVPTRRDTQGLSRDEAMCSGLVPISTQIDAVPEFLSNDEGYLTPPEDPGAIADAVRRLYHNPEEFQRKSAAAADRIRRTLVDDIIIPAEIATFSEVSS